MTAEVLVPPAVEGEIAKIGDCIARDDRQVALRNDAVIHGARNYSLSGLMDQDRRYQD